MVARFPDEVDLQNQLAVSFLITNQAEAAKTILEGVLQRWPESGFAQVHLGFILKTTFDDYEAGAGWMRSGINTRHDGVIDGRFYFHLGDALIRLGRREEAQQVNLGDSQLSQKMNELNLFNRCSLKEKRNVFFYHGISARSITSTVSLESRGGTRSRRRTAHFSISWKPIGNRSATRGLPCWI